VHADMERHVPGGAAKGGGQVFGQDVFAGGLAAGQQQVFAAEQGRNGLLPDLPAVVVVARPGDARAQRIRKGVGLPVRPQLPQQGGADGFFFFQKIKHSLTPCSSKRKGREGRAAASFPPFGTLLPPV